MNDNLIEIHNITKKYGSFTALNDVSVDIKKGEFLCILGPSGCGKTTLLRIIAGLEKPTGGKIILKGEDATNMHPSKRNFGIVFQSYALFPNMTVKENIAFALKNKKFKKDVIEEKVKESLEKVNLIDHINKYPSQLSGGQQQRIALARALVLSPDFLLLDEPLSALDAKVRLKVRKEIKSLQEELGITTIMVTHDQEEALTMADRIIVMNNSCISQAGTPEEIYENPASHFVADFIGEINFFESSLAKDEILQKHIKGNKFRIKAIRPENIEIAKGDEPGITVSVVDKEFHGSSYRLILKIESKDEKVVKGEFISINVPSNEYKQLNVKKNERIKIKFKEDKLIFYNLNTERPKGEGEEA